MQDGPGRKRVWEIERIFGSKSRTQLYIGEPVFGRVWEYRSTNITNQIMGVFALVQMVCDDLTVVRILRYMIHE